MTNTIDELEGHALNVAVAQALGWTPGTGRKNGIWWASDGTHHRRIPPENESASGASYMFDPAHNIATALDELGSGWRWEYTETVEQQTRARLLVVIVSFLGGHERSVVNFADHPTKSSAYATAHCRAFLKAQAAQSI